LFGFPTEPELSQIPELVHERARHLRSPSETDVRFQPVRRDSLMNEFQPKEAKVESAGCPCPHQSDIMSNRKAWLESSTNDRSPISNFVKRERKVKIVRSIAALIALMGLLFGSITIQANDDLLTIGSKAPDIDIEHWVQDGDGKFQHIKEFESGKVYVIEFWATWCGPCIASMPHISQLQSEYVDKGVTVISVSDEDLDTVTEFLEGDSSDGRTYKEVTKNYCLTTDPDGSVNESYMKAAEQGGIPTAFIVGKKGVIEWIGHPMKMDEPLQQIVDDKWDREVFLAEFKEKQELDGKMQKVFVQLQAEKHEEAIEILDKVIADTKNKEIVAQLKSFRTRIVADMSRIAEEKLLAAGDSAAVDLFNKLVAKCEGDSQRLNELAWRIVELDQKGTKVSKELIDAAAMAAEQGVKAAPEEGAILDTLAHLYYLQGELDKAIETQKKALENPGQFEDQIKEFLKTLEDAKKEKSGSDK
jgi:thiol-disulfide isomerase/thioredoxin